MISLKDWLADKTKTAPLFHEQNLIVETFPHSSKTKLKRSKEFDELMIVTVENGLLDDDWEGFIYIMHWKPIDSMIPLYIGKAERRGITQPISFNIENIRKNNHAFGRWGYGLAYHIGELSHAIYREEAYKKPSKKYERWRDTLFNNVKPPTLREVVYVSLISWKRGMKGLSGLTGSVASIEKELIALTSTIPNGFLMNTDGI